MELKKGIQRKNDFHGLPSNISAFMCLLNNRSSKVKSCKCYPQTGYLHKSQKLFVERNYFQGLKIPPKILNPIMISKF